MVPGSLLPPFEKHPPLETAAATNCMGNRRTIALTLNLRQSVIMNTGSGALLLYILDPIEHAWYKGDAVRAYLYLHNYGTGHDADQLAACGILRPEEIGELNLLHGSYQDYYTSPQSAAAQAQTIIGYMAQAKALRVGPYDSLNWLERVRYTLFVHDGLTPPAKWDFLDPGLSQ